MKKKYELVPHIPFSAPKDANGQRIAHASLSQRLEHAGWSPLRLKRADRHEPATPRVTVEVLRDTQSPFALMGQGRDAPPIDVRALAARWALPPVAHDAAAEAKTCSMNPPIRALEGEALRDAVDDFMASLLQPDFGQVPGAQTSEYRPMRTPQLAAWNERLQDAEGIAEMIMDEGHEKRTQVGYFLGDIPVGFMSLSPPDTVGTALHPPAIDIHAIVTHPLTSGGGGALIEHAVNSSLDAGLGGVVRLSPMFGANPAYEAFGFAAVDHNTMVLVPEGNDKWCTRDGRLRLLEHADKTYLENIKLP